MNPYQVLGIETDATTAQIKSAYHAIIKKWHPDLYLNTPEYEKAHDMTAQANLAYEMLKDRGAPVKPLGWEARYREHRDLHQEHERKEREKRAQAGYEQARAEARQRQETRYEEPRQEYQAGSDEESERFVRFAYDAAIAGKPQAAHRFLAMAKARGPYWHYVRGVAHHMERDYTAAIADFEAALRLEPGNSEFRQAWTRTVNARKANRRKKAAIGTVAAAAVTAAAILIFK